MATRNCRAWASLANELERWRDHTGELTGCGEHEVAWHLRGGRVLVVAGLNGHEMFALPGYTPVVALPPTPPGEEREVIFRAAGEELDRERAGGVS